MKYSISTPMLKILNLITVIAIAYRPYRLLQPHEGSEGDMSLKNPVTPPGIDPGTVRLVAQRLNHYATPRPRNISTIHIYMYCT